MFLTVLFIFTFLILVKSKDNSQEIKNVAKEALRVDKMLFKMLNHLKSCSGNSLLDTICQYNMYLQNMTVLVKEDRDSAQPYLDEFLKTGNPKFLEVEHSDFKLKFMMRWADDSLATYHHLCVRSYNHWADLMFLHNNFTKFI